MRKAALVWVATEQSSKKAAQNPGEVFARYLILLFNTAHATQSQAASGSQPVHTRQIMETAHGVLRHCCLQKSKLERMSAFTRILLLFAALSLAAFGIFLAQQGEDGRALGCFGLMLLLGFVAAVGWFSHRFTLPEQQKERNVWKYLRALESAYPNQPLWIVKYLWVALAVIVLLLKVYQAR